MSNQQTNYFNSTCPVKVSADKYEQENRLLKEKVKALRAEIKLLKMQIVTSKVYANVIGIFFYKYFPLCEVA